MSKCSCYHEKFINPSGYWQGAPVFGKFVGICYGTKECDRCSCGGDVHKCDFYPEKRKEAKNMNTLDMMNLAKATGETYKCDDLRYNHKDGFHGEDGTEWIGAAFHYLNDLLELEWHRENEMTKKEAEKKFGIKIID